MRKRFISVCIVAIIVFAFYRYALTVGEIFVPEPHYFTVKNMDDMRLYGTKASDFYITNVVDHDSGMYYINSEHRLYRQFYDYDDARQDKNNYNAEDTLIAENVIHVDSYAGVIIILTKEGRLYGMGNGKSTVFNVLKMDADRIDAPVLLMEDVAYALCGNGHIVVLKKDGTVWTWGLMRASRWDHYPEEEPVKLLENAVMISGRFESHAALLEDGTVWTWGDNRYDQCGVQGQGYFDEPVCVARDAEAVWMQELYFNNDIMDWKKASQYANPRGTYTNLVIKKKDGSLWACGKDIKGENSEEQDGVTYSYEFVPCEIVPQMPTFYDGPDTYQSILEEFKEEWEPYAVYYSLSDLTGDGTEELVIGFLIDDEYIPCYLYAYDMDEHMIDTVWGDTNRPITMYENGIFESYWYAGGEAYYDYFQLQQDSAVVRHLDRFSEDGWADTVKEKYHRNDTISITEKEYKDAIISYQSKPQKLAWYRLGGYLEPEFSRTPVTAPVMKQEEVVYYTLSNTEKFYQTAEEECGLSREEADRWFDIVTEDDIFDGDAGEITGLLFDDIDGNGQTDMIIMVQETEMKYLYGTGAMYFYMNDDEPYCFADEDVPYFGWNICYADLNEDGNVEVAVALWGTGNGGSGDWHKVMFSYTGSTMERFEFPYDRGEDYEIGLMVDVIMEPEPNTYTAYCPYLDESITYWALNGWTGDTQKAYLAEAPIGVGGNLRGYYDLQVVTWKGRDALQVSEYLYGEGGNVHGVGVAHFILVWDKQGNGSVADWWIEERIYDYEDESEPQVTTGNSQGIPGITIASPYSINVCIQNKTEYETFINRLAQYSDCTILWMDLSGTNTIVYMDEILKYDNFKYVHIKNGGIISVRDMDKFRCTLSGIELEYVSVIKEGVLSHITFDHESGEDQILVTLNNRYLGKPPTGEVLHDVDCTNIKLEWNGNAKGSGLLEGQEIMENLKEWDYLRSMQEREEQNSDIHRRGCLKALYRYNNGDYSYTSYEFYRNYRNWVEFNDGFICIKDRETDGEDYFDMMDVPEIRDRFFLGTLYVDQRFCTSEDVNFDGYKDLIFWQDHTDSYDGCILFLWDDTKQRFAFSKSAPECISYVDEERERLIFVTGTGRDYYIYEADGNKFIEKRLNIVYDNAVGNHIVARYYVDDELIAKVMEDEANPGHYIYEEIEGTREEIEAETLAQVVEIYFPDFDFYPAG